MPEHLRQPSLGLVQIAQQIIRFPKIQLGRSCSRTVEVILFPFAVVYLLTLESQSLGAVPGGYWSHPVGRGGPGNHDRCCY